MFSQADYLTDPSTPPGSSNIDGLEVVSPASSVASSVASPHSVQRSSLFAVEVPLDFVGKTFAYVFQCLLSSDAILALGVYRCRPDPTLMDVITTTEPVELLTSHGGNNGGDTVGLRPKARIEQSDDERSVPFGFVYVNPAPGDILSGNDLLYVLSHKQPCWA